jgi:hypothetical protein
MECKIRFESGGISYLSVNELLECESSHSAGIPNQRRQVRQFRRCHRRRDIALVSHRPQWVTQASGRCTNRWIVIRSLPSSRELSRPFIWRIADMPNDCMAQSTTGGIMRPSECFDSPSISPDNIFCAELFTAINRTTNLELDVRETSRQLNLTFSEASSIRNLLG